MFILTAEMQKNVSTELIGLFQKDLEKETYEAWNACMGILERATEGKIRNELSNAISNYDYLNSQYMFESGMKLGAQLAQALFEGGKIA